MAEQDGSERDEGVQDGGIYVSGFVVKLFQMVNDAPNEVVSWLPSGDAFCITNLDRLENETLPAFFRHSRFQSLVRQLNFYNFRKINRERTVWIYHHPLFHRDRPESLHMLRRRTCPGVDGRRTRHDLNSDKYASFLSGDRTSFPDDMDSDDESMTSDEPPLKKPKSSGAKRTYRKPSSVLPPSVSTIVDRRPTTVTDEARTFSQFQNRLSLSRRHEAPLVVSESESPVSLSEAGSLSGGRQSSAAMTNNQSTLLSKLSRKLEEHIKRANMVAASVNRSSHRGGGGKRRMVGVVTPPQPFHSDTMKYNALTYDDDGEEGGGDNITATFEGLDDDNVCSSIAQSIQHETHPCSKYPCDSVSVNSSECCSSPENENSVYSTRSSSSPTLDKYMETEMKKRLQSWVFHGTFSTVMERAIMSSAVCFCLATTPADPYLRDKALEHMKWNHSLAQEFQRYKGALLGTEIGTEIPFLDKQSLPDLLFGGGSESIDTTRIFKMFVVNYLRNFMSDPKIWKGVNFSHPEACLFQSNVKIWVDGVLSSF